MSASREHRQRLYEQLVGQNIAGRFKITSLLGFGGMGAVYEAIQRNMQRSVALKVIPSHDPTTTARFKREALTISKLHHPNTVTVFDYGETDQGLLFLAMEMLTGRTLSELIQTQAPIAPEQAVHITTQICRSLGEAHSSGIVHRDIKPDNIFLIEVDDDPSFVKVLDFGIAKIVRGEDNVELTGTGRIIGTPKYMSPEQILAEAIDHRSDLYSLGCMLFEMLCGSPPFEDTSTTKLMLAHAHQSPPTFAERLPNQALARIPGPLEHVVRRALAKSPSERHSSTGEFREELELALEASGEIAALGDPTGETQMQHTLQNNDPVNAEITDSSDLLAQHSSQTLAKLKSPAAPEPAPTEPREPREAPAPTKSSNAPLIAIASVLGLIAALGGYAFFNSEDTTEAQPTDEAAMVIEEQPAEADEPEPNEPVAATKPDVDEGSKPARAIEVRIASDPEDAQVYEEGRYVGKTPLTIETEAGSTLEYTFELEGYQERKASFDIDPDDPSPVFMIALDKEAKPTSRRSRRTRKTRRSKKKPEDKSKSKTSDGASKNVRPNIQKLDDEEPADDPGDDGPKVDRL